MNNLRLQVGERGQHGQALTNTSMILQSAWSRYGTPEQNKRNIMDAWPLIVKTCLATGNKKLLGIMSPIIKRVKADIILCSDSWFYSFLLMVEGEELRDRSSRRQRYVVKGRY